MIQNTIFPVRTVPEGRMEYIRQVQGRHLKHPRDVVIWLPPSYLQNRRKRYPVLYVHDGQNIMDPSTAFLGVDWRIDEAATRLIRTGKIEELIIVGIYNTPEREQEYTCSKSGRHFAEFVVQELKPQIDATYRTKPDRKNTGVMGSSLGGLISFCFAWWHPETFQKVACLSSSFFWNNGFILKDVRNDPGPRRKIKLYLDVGSREKYLRPGYEEMSELLLQKGYRKGVDLEYHVALGASHNEQSWGIRVWRPLEFLFGKKRTKKVEKPGLQATI